MSDEWSLVAPVTIDERLDGWKKERQQEHDRAKEVGDQMNIGEDFSELLDIALDQRSHIADLKQKLAEAEKDYRTVIESHRRQNAYVAQFEDAFCDRHLDEPLPKTCIVCRAEQAEADARILADWIVPDVMPSNNPDAVRAAVDRWRAKP